MTAWGLVALVAGLVMIALLSPLFILYLEWRSRRSKKT